MKQKLSKFFRSGKGKITCAALSSAASLVTPISALAAEDSAAISGIKSIWTILTEDLNVPTLVTIIGICLGACVLAALFWFGIRYVTRKIMAAIKKGRVSP